MLLFTTDTLSWLSTNTKWDRPAYLWEMFDGPSFYGFFAQSRDEFTKWVPRLHKRED